MSQSKPLIIDVHGHYTTAPKALEDWRNRQIAGIKDPASMPKVSELKISDDELRETIETNQLAKMRERGREVQHRGKHRVGALRGGGVAGRE